MRRILVPIDFASRNFTHLHYAIHLASKTKALLVLQCAHRIPDILPDTITPLKNLQNITHMGVINAMMEVNRLHDVTLMNGLSFKYFSSTDIEAKSILRIIQQTQPDVICINVRERSLLERMLGGSRIETLIDKLDHCSILAIPPLATYQVPQQMIYATSLTTSPQRLQQLYHFVHLLDAFPIHFVHTIVEETRSYGEKRSAFIQNSNNIFGEKNYELAEMSNSYVEEVLDGYTQMHGIDLVIMQRHKQSVLDRLFTDSLPKKMAVEGSLPVLIFTKQLTKEEGSEVAPPILRIHS